MSARSLFLAATLVALASAGIFEGRVILRQREELHALQKRIADATRQAASLRVEREATQRKLDTVEQELAAHPASPNVDAVSATRQKETTAWLVRVKQLKQLFDDRPDQRIPEMQALTDEDWLRVARRASFEDEHATRKALGELRSSAKQKFFTRLGPALREFARVTDAEPPSSILALAPYFEAPIDAETLERYEIVKGSSSSGRELLVREKIPVDVDYDSRSQMTAQANGSSGLRSIHAPVAWMTDFQERTQRAYRTYMEANQGARPAQMAQALPYFNPPLDPAKIELLLRFERERGP